MSVTQIKKLAAVQSPAFREKGLFPSSPGGTEEGESGFGDSPVL